MNKAEKMKTAACLYLNYVVYGMAIVILAQNMNSLRDQWNVDSAGVSFVISSLGIGHLLVLYVAGILSDRFGRKIFVGLGILTYLPFFLGIIFCKNLVLAYILGIMAGMANSFLDAGTYPTLMDLFPQHEASANIMIKAFSSVGELLLPILVSVLDISNMWYGWVFILGGVILIGNLVYLQFRKFPKLADSVSNQSSPIIKKTSSLSPSRKVVSSIVLTIFGYIGMATFYLISQWLTEYGTEVLHLHLTSARLLVSIYSVGSIFGVLLTAIIVNRLIKQVNFMLADTIVSLITLFLMAAFPVYWVVAIGGFVIGVSATGGVLQIGLTLMSDLYPEHKGRVLGIYYTASGLASFTIPIFTSFIAKESIRNIMWFDVGVAVLGVICAVATLLLLREKKTSIA